MPGMSSGVSPNNPIIVAAFHSSLLRQGLVVLAILALLAMCWNILRAMQLRRSILAATAGRDGSGGGSATASAGTPRPEATAPLRPLARMVEGAGEPPARRLLRIVFGCLWLLDGALQAQAQMPAGMTTQAIDPTAQLSPTWVQHVVNFGTTIWTDHPIVAASAAVWIQLGIGALLLVGPRGRWSRAAGLLSVGWGLVVWVFGESFGGLFAPGNSFLFGTPGAVLFYCIAGALIALPERAWSTADLGRWMVRLTGVFLIGMALLEAWPGRGFWQGQVHHAAPGQLTAMAQSMAQTPQPTLLASLIGHFASFVAAHGWAVNLFAVIALAVLGVLLAVAVPQRRLVRFTLGAVAVFCAAVWVFVQDLGFLGGVGTDPNSMVPFFTLVVAGYLALSPAPATADARADAPDGAAATPALVGGPSLRGRRLGEWREALLARPSYLFRSIAAVGMVGVFLVGAAPMAFASVSSGAADPVIWEAVNGPLAQLNEAAPQFTLTDQYGHKVSLASLHGKVVALAFLDPVCTSDCPLIAQELRQADQMLGSLTSKVEMVAVVANPIYRSMADTKAFDRQEGLDHVHNWLFLTGSVAQLGKVWDNYGVEIAIEPGGAMILHNDLAYVIDAAGRMRAYLGTDPGPGTQAYESSFAGVLAGEVRGLIG
jgi:cytochrome oxidase Cu insertion factor (SCO1/SenC/PrrC family)